MKSKLLSYRLIYIVLIVLSLLMPGCACLYEECNCEEFDTEVNVVYEWEKAHDANPEGMSVLFYPINGNPYWRFEISKLGGNIKLPKGDYNVMSFNSDTSSIIFENQEDYESALITCRESDIGTILSSNLYGNNPPRNAADTLQPILQTPDMIWCAKQADVETSAKPTYITMTPVPLIAKYTVRILNVENIESAYQAGMSISSLSSGRILSTGQALAHDVTMAGSLQKNGDNSMSATINTFGRISGRGNSHLLVYFYLRDGERKAFQYNVTSLIENAPDPMNVEIIIDSISLPIIETSHPDSGLEVGIDEWETIEIELSS